jgi:hypothetical protein
MSATLTFAEVLRRETAILGRVPIFPVRYPAEPDVK